MSKILEKSEKKLKNPTKKKLFSQRSKHFDDVFFAKKNAFLLVLLIEEISLQPELSSPPRLRIQGVTLSVTQEQL